MIILGIDPGTAALGYGILERTGSRLRAVDWGVLSTPPSISLPERLLALHAHVAELVELHGPTVVGVERLFFSRNAQTAFGVGQARGVVLLAAAQHGLPVHEATPSEVKRAIAGDGRADKTQVQRMLRLVLDLAEEPAPDDAADALAVAVWVANTLRTYDRPGSGVLDRSAIAPLERAESAFDRAVRDALVRERAAAQPVRATRRRAS